MSTPPGALRALESTPGSCHRLGVQGSAPTLPPPVLCRILPELAERIPRHPFVSGPTPVRPLSLDGVPDGRLYCKDDSRSCPSYGGNKPRKLEWVIGAALAGGARRLVTTGAIGSHHGLATTILGREVGLATTLVLIDQPFTPHVEDTVLAQLAYGAETICAGSVPRAALHGAWVLCRSTVLGERPHLVSTGGSSAVGNLGFVSAGLELADQIRAGECPEPEAIYVPIGSGGTAAGLVLGLRMAGLTTRVVGVLVTDILSPTRSRILRAARASARLIERNAGGFVAPALDPERLEVLDAYIGPGYGAPTSEGREALEAAAAAGLLLDDTYSAKCLAAIRSRARSGRLESGPVVFWNTLNAVDVWPAAPRAKSDIELPERVRRMRSR